MKKIFEILQEERDRILKMHQNATKRQYLNEQTVGPFNPVTVAQSRNNFQINPNLLRNNNPIKKSSYTTTKINVLLPPNKNEDSGFALNKNVKFDVTTDPQVLRSKNASVFRQRKVGKNGEWFNPAQKSVSFYCNKNKFFVQGDTRSFDSATLANVLKSYVCGYKAQPQQPQQQKLTDEQKLERAKNCGHSTWDAYQKSGWSCSGSQNTTQPNLGEPINQEPVNQAPTQSNPQVVDLNTQIQQLLGNQSPTGQISDAEIDQILAKLG